jgi:hypothetical protein
VRGWGEVIAGGMCVGHGLFSFGCLFPGNA